MSDAPTAPTGESSPPRLPQRADVQGLRALAVGLVVLDHVGVSWLPGGFVGVDVFFVVSGYLISSLLLRELGTTGRVRIGAFYARRARRILPAATVVLALVTVASALRLPLARSAEVAHDVLWSTLFAANIHFARVGTDYFGADAPPSPVQHFWSLAVEEQFYLVWPATLALVGLLAVRVRGLRTLRVVTLIVAVAWALSLVWSVVLTGHDAIAAYFSTPARAWELATGTLLALFAQRLMRLPDAARLVLAPLGAVAIVVAAVAYGPQTPFPGWQALLPVLGTAAILAAGADGRAVGAARALTLRPVTWVGDISYSLYLWHWPVIVLGTRHVPGPFVAQVIVLIAISIALAAASYHVVEAPFRTPRRLWSTTPRALVLWPVAVALVLGTIAWSARHRDGVVADRTASAASFDPSSVPPDERAQRTGDRVHDLIAASLDRATVGGPIPFPIENDLTDLDADRPAYPQQCTALDEQSTAKICPMGDTSSDTLVVLLGDSHMQMWLPGVLAEAEKAGFEVVPIIKYGCPPADVPLKNLSQPGDPPYQACYDWRSWALEQIRRLDPDLVVMTSRAPPPGVIVPPGSTREEVWTEAVAQRARDLTEIAPRVVVAGDVSYLRRDPAACVGRQGTTMADCTTEVDPDSLAFMEATKRAAQSAGVAYADLNQLVCLDGKCPMVVDHAVTYHDGQHVSATWAAEVGPELGRLLQLP
ncbi:acyltransferase family protein [Nocardioides acrostichi]|uniref:Acyltransferase n=1 Tax=Nocardioides acrostichi TaxID=2784339 RepID=A0A930UUL3_9ACTN|nr:acyltransferase family protein [Nocardioides acrostichi]MBF4161143.1 acyltransferase [Nocardioides acrostichi]